jgi:hypothetical protein
LRFRRARDLLSGRAVEGESTMELDPYEILWLERAAGPAECPSWPTR